MSNYQYYEYQQNDGGYGVPPYVDNTPPKQKKPKKEHKFLKTIGKTMVIGAVFGMVAGGVFQGTVYVSNHALGTDVTEVVEAAKDNTTEKSSGSSLSNSDGKVDSTKVSTATTVTDVSDIASNVMPSIVAVTNISLVEYRNFFGVGQYETESAGSGIIISQDDNYLYIATNNHVVEGTKSLTITFCDDSAVAAEVQGTDVQTDLAVVKVKLSDVSADTLSAIKVATLGSSEDLKVGESAIVIGNALGYGQSVTGGMISATAREVTLSNETTGETYTNTLIQTDAAVNPGNSGGALLNMNGEVIGIVSAKYSDTSVEGMGYAIPITDASEIITQLMNNGTVTNRPAKEGEEASEQGAYLGIGGVDISRSQAIAYNMPQGVYVATVMDGGGAKNAGIQKGDVITGIDGTTITSMEEMQKMLKDKKPGDTVTVTFCQANNNYAQATVQVTLTEKLQ
ncbi:MAG: trypsin-like peptidase domain-containing protein [Lachnospiraceae bacterium]|nr:trypsin-like peptidase domain-containing protein [Lachnospiraceae bacterium]